MKKTANFLWVILMAAPLLYIGTSALVVGTAGGLAGTDSGLLNLLFIALLIVSATVAGFIFYTQTSQSFLLARMKRDPLGRAFQVLSLGSILSEAVAVYGYLLTLLSGLLTYVVGFSAASWVLLVWVRTRFTSNLENIPADVGGSGSEGT